MIRAVGITIECEPHGKIISGSWYSGRIEGVYGSKEKKAKPSRQGYDVRTCGL